MTSDSKISARVLASRQNGARSRGPKTVAGKAISARNALKHGLNARTVVLDGEDVAAFQAFQAALRAELAPASVLQHDLVSRIALGLWRARRSDRIEAALLKSYLERARGRPGEERDLGLAVIRDAHGPRALDTLLRYRGSAHAELFRGLGALKALQAEAAGVGDDQNLLPAATARARAPHDETNPRAAASLGCEPVHVQGSRRPG